MIAPLDAGLLAAAARAAGFAGRVVVLDEVGSTNDVARGLAADGAPPGTVVLAAAQTAGRGRLGRRWHSPVGAGLYLSLLLRPAEPLDRIGRWAIAAAVAVYEGCARFVPAGLALEWPNDLLAGGRKLAGILAETRAGEAGAELVLGIGVNVAHRPDDFPEALRPAATSLGMLRAGAPPAREEVASAILERLGEVRDALERGAWEGIAARFLRYAPRARGCPVRLAGGRTGTTAGIDGSGALRVATPSGTVVVHASESVEPMES